MWLKTTEAKASPASATEAYIETFSGMTADDCYNMDPAHRRPVEYTLHGYWAHQEPEVCQNKDTDFKTLERIYKQQKQYFFSKGHFLRRHFESECRYWT